MRANVLNAPARPPLTRSMLVLLVIALLFGSLAGIALGGPRVDTSAADRPRFARRMVALPAVVATPPDTIGARR
jgi:hypothetical protein